ncbi:hypothetical protein BH11BAC6_BH11BAC6_10520 [soil metagenome]
MIQRIQSVWLLLAAVCALLSLKLSFYTGILINDPKRLLVSLNSTTTIPIVITAVSVGIASLVAIFLYKDRKMQMRILFAILLASLLLIFLYFSYVKRSYTEGSYDITAPVIFLVPLFLLLALRGIYKDQKLVKSLDRIR